MKAADVEVSDYLDALDRDGQLLVRAVEYAGLDAPVPSCPGWAVRRLVQHTAKVHHWATEILRGSDPSSVEFERPTDAQTIPVFQSGLATLIATLEQAPADLEAWTFFPVDSPLDFWARRQANETAIHRIDAELAAEYGVSAVAADFAVAGLDELLLAFIPDRPTTWDGLGAPRTITFEPLDANQSWSVTVGDGVAESRAGAEDGSDLTVFGESDPLYRWVWNRIGDDEVSLRGDLTLADEWHARFRIG